MLCLSLASHCWKCRCLWNFNIFWPNLMCCISLCVYCIVLYCIGYPFVFWYWNCQQQIAEKCILHLRKLLHTAFGSNNMFWKKTGIVIIVPQNCYHCYQNCYHRSPELPPLAWLLWGADADNDGGRSRDSCQLQVRPAAVLTLRPAAVLSLESLKHLHRMSMIALKALDHHRGEQEFPNRSPPDVFEVHQRTASRNKVFLQMNIFTLFFYTKELPQGI